MKDWIRSGRIAAEAREYGKTLIKVNASLLEVTEKIENKIISLGGSFAFPPQLSRNEIAAHYNALCNDTLIFQEGDVVKLDLGVHVNGAIGDTACTIDLGENKQLIKASEEALKNAIKEIKNKVKVYELGKVIQETIQKYGFSPIRNLSGHGLDIYTIHDTPSIPNYDNKDNSEVRNCFIAIEPFATNGIGLVADGKPSEIYTIVRVKPIRNADARKILKFIIEEYHGLPFAKRWLLKEFDRFKVSIALSSLEKEGILMQYNQLVEKEKGFVSQCEHSVYVGDEI